MLIFVCTQKQNIGKIAEVEWDSFGAEGKIENIDFIKPIENFYLNNDIARASATMHACHENANKNKLEKSA